MWRRKRHSEWEPDGGETLASLQWVLRCTVLWSAGIWGTEGSCALCYFAVAYPPPANACRSRLVLGRKQSYSVQSWGGDCIYFFILRYFSCSHFFFLILSLFPTESILQQLWRQEHWVMNPWAHKEQKAVSRLLATQAASGPCWLIPLWVWLMWDVFKSCLSVRHVKLFPFPTGQYSNLTHLTKVELCLLSKLPQVAVDLVLCVSIWCL